MVLPDDGDGDFSGIDPQALWDLITSIKNHTGPDGGTSAVPATNGWLSAARRIGLDTGPLNSINKHFAWAQDQLPMLRRRHSLAADAARENADFGLSGGMVAAGADGLGGFATQAAAAKAGQDDAKKFKDGDMSVEDYLKKVRDHQSDPDYAKAAATALGPSWLATLEQDSSVLDENDPDAGLDAVAGMTATAMRGGVTFKDAYGNEDIRLLSGLVGRAVFPASVLTDLGSQALASGNTMYSDRIWKALAAEPKAATRFVHDNIDYLPPYMRADSEHTGGLIDPNVKDFAAVIEAGTVGGPGADTALAADNTTKLVNHYADHPDDHTHPEIQQVFADDITHYWSDVRASLTDPAPVDPGPGHVSVSGAAWEGFIHESMQDSRATAELLAFSKQMSNELADSDPDNPEVQHAAGLIDGTFGYEATKVFQEKQADSAKKASDWQTDVSTQLGNGITTGVLVAFDPAAALSTISSAAIRDVLTTFSSHMVKVDPKNMGDPPSTATWRDDWTEAAHQSYVKDHDLGRPQTYADAFSGGAPFLTDDGHLVADASAGQKAAYNEWLKDPAVAGALDRKFLDRDLGRSTSMTGVH